jgi:hypothetical protein
LLAALNCIGLVNVDSIGPDQAGLVSGAES